MKTLDCSCTTPMSRRQVCALLAAFGVTGDALAQDAPTVNPRSYRVLLENDSVRVIEYNSRPGLGVCGEGIHSHPAHLAILLTAAKVREVKDGKTTFDDLPRGKVMYFEAEVHSAENVGGAGTRIYLVEMKGKDWKPSSS